MELKEGMMFELQGITAKYRMIVVSFKHPILEDTLDNDIIVYKYHSLEVTKKRKEFLKMIDDGLFKFIK